MKKIILLVLFLSVLFIALVFVYYILQPENVYLPSSLTFILFCGLIKLLYNQNEKKGKRVFPIGKSINKKVTIIGIIIFLICIALIEIFGSRKETWMNIGFSVFYGIDFCLMMLILYYKPYLFALRKKRIIFCNVVMPFEYILYTNIQQVVIESNIITFVKHDGNQIYCNIELTEKEKNNMIHILTNNKVAVIS